MEVFPHENLAAGRRQAAKRARLVGQDRAQIGVDAVAHIRAGQREGRALALHTEPSVPATTLHGGIVVDARARAALAARALGPGRQRAAGCAARRGIVALLTEVDHPVAAAGDPPAGASEAAPGAAALRFTACSIGEIETRKALPRLREEELGSAASEDRTGRGLERLAQIPAASCGNHRALILQSYCNHIAAIQQPHSNHTAIIQQSSTFDPGA